MVADNHSSTCAPNNPVNALFGLLSQGNHGTPASQPDLILPPLLTGATCFEPPGRSSSPPGRNLEREFSSFVASATDRTVGNSGPALSVSGPADTAEATGRHPEFFSQSLRGMESVGLSCSAGPVGGKDSSALAPSAVPIRRPAALSRGFAEIWDSAVGGYRNTLAPDRHEEKEFSREYHPERVTALYIESCGGPAAICPIYSCLVPTLTATPSANHISGVTVTIPASSGLSHRSGMTGEFVPSPSSISPQLNAGLQGIVEAERLLLGVLFGESTGYNESEAGSSPSSYRWVPWDWTRMFMIVHEKDSEDELASNQKNQALINSSRQRLALLSRQLSGASISR